MHGTLDNFRQCTKRKTLVNVKPDNDDDDDDNNDVVVVVVVDDGDDDDDYKMRVLTCSTLLCT